MKRGAGLIGSLGVLVISATPAVAQTAPSPARGFVNVNVVAQATSEDVDKALSFTLYNEPASVAVTRATTGGVIFDVTGGIALRGGWSVGLNFNRRSNAHDGTYTGQIPDPIKFDTFRNVNGTIADLAYSERWIAALLFYDLPVSAGGLTAQAFVGPAVARVQMDIVDDVTVTEPNDTPVITPSIIDGSRSLMGAQAGVDLKYAITPEVGVGVLVRYQHARGTLPGNTRVTVGGFQIGGGIRLTF